MVVKISEINRLLEDRYHISGDVKPLDGDVDYNFKIKTHDNTYLLKICRLGTKEDVVQFQVELLNYLKTKDFCFDVPSVLQAKDGSYYFLYDFGEGKMFVRMHSWVFGHMLGDVNPRTKELFLSWGETCGRLSLSLAGFDHKYAHRFERWNPTESLHSKNFLSYIDEDKQALANYFWDLFDEVVTPVKDTLRSSVNYSDAHEHNLLITNNYKKITGVIDFGDAVFGPTICELAIACAYAGMYQEDPIESMSYVVAGYHSQYPLEEKEIEVLFALICGRLMITVANAANSKHKEPENLYLQISVKPAWDLLEKLADIDSSFIHYYFRSACDLEPCPKRIPWNDWFAENEKYLATPINISDHKSTPLDLSVGSLDLGNNSNFENPSKFTRTIDDMLRNKNTTLGIGGYCEVRPFYTTDAYKEEGNNGARWRTVHLGTDYWVKEGEDVHAVYEGVIHSFNNNDAYCDYGPTIILEHQTNSGSVFYTLYGHLSIDSIKSIEIGDSIKTGDTIGQVGTSSVNGGWPPHLHFQIMLDLFGNSGDFPGVCFIEESKLWSSVCPDLNQPNSNAKSSDLINEIFSKRSKSLGKSLSISYAEPLHIVRGYGQYLYDETGRRYLDTVNNVAHVGHEHPRVVKVASRQISVLNTNTRYLHKNITDYATRLLSKFPEELDKVYFVNSGSEANELALRMAKVYSNQKDIIALETGYHGNTGATIDISSYKFDGRGGQGAPKHTSIVPMPDTYRGKCKDKSVAAEFYTDYIVEAVKNLKIQGRNVAGFIAESILSCGGQIVLPPNYLKEAYKIIRAEGGLCIADEVQVGFGRVGSHFWGFELQGVVPDIVTCGKPIGNGHPLAAVVTSSKVADAFTNGMEYFNTFGGNPVSCAIGLEVLNIIESENLQQKANDLGTHLINKLNELKQKHEIIGDVRGVGLFCGFELVRDRNTLEPADQEATYIANRMRELGFLMSTDGPLHNVIKIKPPMCITEQNINDLISRLDGVLREVVDILKFSCFQKN